MYGAFLRDMFESEFLHVVAITGYIHVAHPDGAADGRTHRAHLALPHGRPPRYSVYSSTWRLYSSSGIYSVSQSTHLCGV